MGENQTKIVANNVHGKKLTNGLEKAKEHAKNKNGQCLSTEYINSHSKLEWKCKNPNHSSWFSSYTSIIHSKTWCHECGKDNYDNSTTRLANSLIKAKAHALTKKGECLTTQRFNGRDKLEWKCSNPTHSSWLSSYNNVINTGSWCPECGKESMVNKKRLIDGLTKAKNHAITKDGECLSNECINSESKLEWKCNNTNHSSWFAKYTNVINGNWCPECGKESMSEKRKISNGLQIARDYVLSKGGQCLSTEYISSQTKMEWKCRNPNHSSWFAKYSHVINTGSWCPECGKENFHKSTKLQNGLEKAKEHAKSKGGECLSIECLDSQSKLEWKCINPMHTSWLAAYTNVINNNNWCRQCRIELDFPKERYFKRANDHAESKGGKCLSIEYINNYTKMEWKCSDPTHPSWLSCYYSIINFETWCPECSLTYNLQEFKVQQILNYLFKTKFVKNRSWPWNVNPKTGYILELDGYSENLKMAFEFQGRHHFEDNIFKGTNLEDIQYKDKVKKDNCYNNGIQLIVVNEIRTKNCLKFFNQILASIQEAGITLPLYDYSEIESLYKLRPDDNNK